MTDQYMNIPGCGDDEGGGGTVTSVGLAAPGIFTVLGSPVTTSGTLTLVFTNETANTVFAGPASGGATAPTFRALVSADIPALPYLSNNLTNNHIFVGNASNQTQDVPAGGDLTLANTASVGVFTFNTVNSNVGSFGTASSVGSFTANGKGLITAASNVSIQIAESQVTNLVSDLASKMSNALTSAHIFVGNGSNIATDVAVSGDLTLANTGAFTIANNAVTNAKLAQMPTLTIKGNNSGITANASDLTVAQVNLILPVFTSTLNGLAPLSGGGSTNFLRADGTWAAPAGSGVTSVSVVTANGFAGTVATPTTTPAITISTTITGLLKGNGTAVSAAVSGTDYSAGTSGLTTGILKSTTGTGALTIAVAGDFPTLNQNTTGSAASLSATLNVATGGTGNTTFTAYSVITAGTTATGPFQNVSGVGTTGQVLTSNGAATLPTWQTFTASNGFTYPTTGSSYGGTNTTSGFSGIDNTIVGNAAGVALTTGHDNTFFGSAVDGVTTGNFNTLIGALTTANVAASNDVVIGAASSAGSASDTIVIGKSLSGSTQTVIIGNTNTSGANGVVVGYGSTAGANTKCVLIGDSNNATASDAIVIGYSSTVGGLLGTAIGFQSSATTTAVGIGYTANASASNSVAIGQFSLSSGSNAVAIGNSATASASNTTAIGNGASTAVANQMQLGNTSVVSVSTSGRFDTAATQTTVSGATSGTAQFSEPFSGSSYKKVIVYCNALVGAASYTYPVAFTNTPVVVTTSGPAPAVVTAISTTAVTVTGSGTTGIIVIEGY